jgi:hypothetical protein
MLKTLWFEFFSIVKYQYLCKELRILFKTT